MQSRDGDSRHFCGMQSFVSGPLFISIRLFYSRHTKLPGRSLPGDVPVPAAGAGRGQLPAPPAPVTATSQGAARPSSPLATASARCRRCCSLASQSQRSLSSPSQRSPLLRRGRPRRRRPPRPRLRRHCRRRNSTAGNLPKAYQIMRNDATWKRNQYLCSVKIHVTNLRWESLHHKYSCNFVR